MARRNSSYRLFKSTFSLVWWATKKLTGIDTFFDIIAPQVRKGSKKRRIRLDGIEGRTKKVLSHNIIDNFLPGSGFILDAVNPITAPQKSKRTNFGNSVYVPGYYRKNGTYVKAHYKRK